MSDLQVIFASLALIVSALSFVFGQVLSHGRARRHVERVASQVAAQLSRDVLSLIVERLSIRFIPEDRTAKYAGHSLREYRATCGVDMLREIKIGELPFDAIEHFVRFRAAIQALNSAMNVEGQNATLPLDAYKRVFDIALPAYNSLQEALSKAHGVSVEPIEWSLPEKFQALIWAEFQKHHC